MLNTIWFQNNEMGVEELRPFVDFLKDDKRLKFFSLWNNNIGNEGGKLLLECIEKHNASLNYVYLYRNNIDQNILDQINKLTHQNEHSNEEAMKRIGAK